jgi:hypothetical protein
MTHNCNYELDLDGQVTCSNCGAMDDDASTPITLEMFETQTDFE